MSTHFGLRGRFELDPRKVEAWKKAPVAPALMRGWAEDHSAWFVADFAKTDVRGVLASFERLAKPFFLRWALEADALVLHGMLGEELDGLEPLVGALRQLGAHGGRGELLVVALDDGPVAKLLVDKKRASWEVEDLDLIDLPAFVAAIETARSGGTPAPVKERPSVDTTAGDRGVFAWLLFPADKGRSARKWLKAPVEPSALDDWGDAWPFARAFEGETAAAILARAAAFGRAGSELVDIQFDGTFDLKVHAVLQAANAAEWLPRIAALLRVANAHGAEGDLAIADMDGPDAFFAELRKKTAATKTLDEKALLKALRWPLRKTLRQVASR